MTLVPSYLCLGEPVESIDKFVNLAFCRINLTLECNLFVLSSCFLPLVRGLDLKRSGCTSCNNEKAAQNQPA